MNKEEQLLLNELFHIIENTKKQIVSHANSSLTILFWHLGKRINEEILNKNRAGYGKRIVVSLSRDLVYKFGRSYEEKNLRRMIQFAEKYNDFKKVVTLSRHLSWSHFLILIPIKNEDTRDFYGVKTYNNLLSIRDLRRNIKQKDFERTENANLQIINNNEIEKGVFKDPYLFDFLDLGKGFLENDLESAILKEFELFILELGKGFTFVERQKRMIIDGDDFYLDLLFYHRSLKRLVAIELKIDKFRAKYKGQMELYLKWLNKYEKQDNEQSPIGLILCSEASKEQIELLEMHKDGIMVAEYLTEFPKKEILEEKLKDSIKNAKKRIESRQNLY